MRGKYHGVGCHKTNEGELFKGHYKDGQRNGPGVCMMVTGAIYRGEWKDDLPHGVGTLYSTNNEIIEAKFD